MSFRWYSLPRRGVAAPKNVARASGRSRANRRRAAFEPLEDRTLLSTSIPLSANTWTPIGPAPILNGQTPPDNGNQPPNNAGSPVSGRIAALAASPTNPSVIYVAAAGGGVWKTTDGGQTWTPLTDNQATLHMGSIAIAPQNERVIYAGTGEANGLLTTRSPFLSSTVFAGKGVLKSTDGGQTWSLMGQFDSNGTTPLFDRTSISKVVIDPSDPTANTVYVAVGTPGIDGVAGHYGIWKTTDGGVSWTDTTTSVTTKDPYTDLVMSPTNPQVLYAAVAADTVDFNVPSSTGDVANGVYVTTDGGKTWNPAGNFPGGAADGRITLAIAPSNANTIYASIVNPAITGNAFGNLLKMEKSTDGGQTWSQLTNAPEYMNGQGFYDTTLAVSPTDPNVVFAGGAGSYTATLNSVIESTDGGASWKDIAGFGRTTGPHPDHHAIGFDAAGHLLDGNDGGIWRLRVATPSAPVWDDINGNLQITTFTNVALDPTNPNVAYGGSQDNGTEKFTDGLGWTLVRFGDGGFVRVDPSHPQTIYHTYFGPSLERSDNGGNTWIDVTPPRASNNGLFFSPYVLDPSNPSRVFYATDQIDVSGFQGIAWTTIASPGSRGFNPTGAPIDALAIAASNANTLYVTAGGHVYITFNNGQFWFQRDVPGAKDGFNQILIDPTNDHIAYLVREQYNGPGNTGHVFKTTNGGASWTDISGNLPNVPAYSIALESLYGLVNKLFVGTDTGVYASSDGGTTWSKVKTGLPNVQVTSLEYNPTLNILAAGTHGRGMWELLGDNLLKVTPTANLLSPIEGVATTFPVLATFTDPGGADPANGYTVTINWGDGATTAGTVNGSGGLFTISGSHTYTEEGSFSPVISVVDADGAVGQATASITAADAPLTATAVALSPVEGLAFSGTVATFTDANPGATLDDFGATIVWGDGNTNQGTISFDAVNKRYVVSGTNTYGDEGTYTLRVTITDVGGAAPAVTTKQVAVSDALLSNGTGLTFTPIEGSGFSGPVATFTDANPNATAGDFTATIDYGDASGTVSTTVKAAGGGRFSVLGAHTYAEEGTYPIHVTVTDKGGSNVTADGSASVSDAALSVSVNGQSALEGQVIPADTVIATLTDAFAGAPASDYTVTVDFGDGVHTAVPGNLAALGSGRYSVTAGNTYADEGTYTITVSVVDKGSSTASGTATATITDAALTATGVTLSAVEGQTLSNAVVATFNDGDASAPASDFTATIDWGNGNVQKNAPVIALGNGNFQVTGTNVYAEADVNPYPVGVSITDDGGNTASAPGKVTVADAPLQAGPPQTFQAIEGVGFNDVVGTFTDADPLSVPKDFLASIDWGDGTQSNAVITQTGPGTPYSVKSAGGGHTYAEETAKGQTYAITVTVVDLAGQRAKLTGTATVADAPITAVGAAAVSLTEGAAFTGTVASFTDAYAGAPSTDYTATIAWGDGHVSAGVITFDTVKQVYNVAGTNAYGDEGTYTITVTVNDVGGSASSAVTTTASVADAKLAAAASNIAPVAGQAFNGLVAQFTDGNAGAPPSDFTATVAWGDGASSAGVVRQPGGPGTPFVVTASHTYGRAAAAVPFSVTVTDKGGSKISAAASAHVVVPLVAVSDTSTDTGASNTDGITSNNRPHFFGTVEPNSEVRLIVTPLGGGGSFVAGQIVSDALGNWSIVSTPLADGRYAVVAQMVDPSNGAVVQNVPLMATATRPPLVIDTTGPVVQSVSFNPAAHQLHITLFDALSGLNPAGLFNAGNFMLGLANNAGVQGFAVNGLAVAPGAPGSGQVFVTVTYNLPRRVRAGAYVVTISALGLSDLAGNTLVERNLVTFPQTTNSPNPNYVAQIDVASNLSASAPHTYVPFREKMVANQFSSRIRGRSVRPRG
jgi:hypothetical protein